MNQQDFADAFALLLSGAAEMYIGKEMMWQKDKDAYVTIEFPTNSPREAIVRAYNHGSPDGLLSDMVTEWKYHDGIPEDTVLIKYSPKYTTDYLKCTFSIDIDGLPK